MIVLWVGDSITVQMLPGLRTEMPKQQLSGRVLGRVGWTARRWARSGELEREVARTRPDALVVCLGTNEEGFDPEAAAWFRGLGRRVIWVGPFQTAAADRQFRSAFGSDFISGVEAGAGLERTRDGVHFDLGAARVLAQRLTAEVGSRLRPRPGRWVVLGASAGTALVLAWTALGRGSWER